MLKLSFTSSVGVYQPAEIFHEESVWKTFPSENDKFAAGLREWVSYKLRPIVYNMVGTRYL